jgi:hypothetical protein
MKTFIQILKEVYDSKKSFGDYIKDAEKIDKEKEEQHEKLWNSVCNAVQNPSIVNNKTSSTVSDKRFQNFYQEMLPETEKEMEDYYSSLPDNTKQIIEEKREKEYQEKINKIGFINFVAESILNKYAEDGEDAIKKYAKHYLSQSEEVRRLPWGVKPSRNEVVFNYLKSGKTYEEIKKKLHQYFQDDYRISSESIEDLHRKKLPNSYDSFVKKILDHYTFNKTTEKKPKFLHEIGLEDFKKYIFDKIDYKEKYFSLYYILRQIISNYVKSNDNEIIPLSKLDSRDNLFNILNPNFISLTNKIGKLTDEKNSELIKLFVSMVKEKTREVILIKKGS